jgi:hypothetical protein
MNTVLVDDPYGAYNRHSSNQPTRIGIGKVKNDHTSTQAGVQPLRQPTALEVNCNCISFIKDNLTATVQYCRLHCG